MSRIGKKPVSIPKGVKVAISGRTVSIEGPKGKLSIEHRPEVEVAWDESEAAITVTVPESRSEDRFARAMWGTTRALLQNMVKGVTQGYEKKMEIVGVGWNAALQGKQLKLSLGYASPVMIDIPSTVSVAAEKQSVTITGADKQQVGMFAAKLRATRPPEPYNGKGVKYADEVIARKEGKKFGS